MTRFQRRGGSAFPTGFLWWAGENWQRQGLGDVNWVFWTTLINSLPGTAANTETTRLWHDGLSSNPAIWGPPPCKTPQGSNENRTLPCAEAWFRWGLLITSLPCDRNRKEKGDNYHFAVFQEELISASQTSGSRVQRPLQSVSSPCAWLHSCDGFSTFCTHYEVLIAVFTESWNKPWLPSELKQKSAAPSFRACSIQPLSTDARFRISEGWKWMVQLRNGNCRIVWSRKPEILSAIIVPRIVGIWYPLLKITLKKQRQWL